MKWNMNNTPRSLVPIFMMPRFNAIIGSFNNEQFAVLSAFKPDLGIKENLERQSELVNKIQSLGLGWFPLFWDWDDKTRRSLFVHRTSVAAAELRRKQTKAAELVIPDPTFELIRSLCREAGLDKFIWGEKGKYLVYAGEPPAPIGTGGKLSLSVDLDFIAFRESQGHLVTQKPKRK